MDNTKKHILENIVYLEFILTMDVDPVADYNGIKKMNVLDWLVKEE